jgi:hypothetical protein
MLYPHPPWPRGQRRRSAAARLLKSWVRIPQVIWRFVCYECCVLSGRRSLRRADHSSRGVLPTVVRRCVWSRKPQEWGGHDPRWVAAPWEKNPHPPVRFCSRSDTGHNYRIPEQGQ